MLAFLKADAPLCSFARKIDAVYTFEVKQYLKFVVYDVDGPGEKQEIGYFECSMGKLCGSKHGKIVDAQLQGDDEGKKLGLITIMAETVKGRKTDRLRLQMRGKEILNKVAT
jgi:hypothetical protein